MNVRRLTHNFDIFVASLDGFWDASLPIAAARTGAVGLLNLVHARDAALALSEVRRLAQLARGRFGVLLDGRPNAVMDGVLDTLRGADCLLFTCTSDAGLPALVERGRTVAHRIGFVVTSEPEARRAVELGADFLIAKGHEAGGRVGEETAFVLFQRLHSRFDLPLHVWGGIGFGTAAACQVGGAAGVVLDWQLGLTRESPLPQGFRARLARMDGSETLVLRAPDGHGFRLYAQPGLTAKDRLESVREALKGPNNPAQGNALGENLGSRPLRPERAQQPDRGSVVPFQGEGGDAALDSQGDALGCFVAPLRGLPDGQLEQKSETWDSVLAELFAEPTLEARLWAVGQDACFAGQWAEEGSTVARLLKRFREQVAQNVQGCLNAKLLEPGSPLARSHGTEFPILQGPMTRVSDVPEFAEAVERGGALPFLALALLRGPRVRELMDATRALMGNRPWGVGILGFVERELRAEQLAIVEEVRPPFAIIAGGRPDQAVSLEARGITTYLHVPSPGMLDTFVREGARRFIFEGRECGGHVGPRSSFVLWETMVRVLLKADLPAAEAAKVHVVFAGGINDGLSGAMVSALAQPLVERGMKIGVLLGTAYLFTEEIVRTGAILSGFQDVALGTNHTVLVESGPGHAVRCADTAFVQTFEEEKQRLKREGCPAEDIRSALEDMNIGRLRIASKGITRIANPAPGDAPFAQVDDAEQRREGMYMIGQIAALRNERCTIRQLHEEVCQGALEHLRDCRLQIADCRMKDNLQSAICNLQSREPALDIAVIGLACFLPGAQSIDELWRNILAKRDLITEVPAQRFEADRWFDPDRKARDKIYSKWGGFLGEIPFDPLKFGIPPTAIPSIEPGQLLALELVDRVLRDAGYADHNPHRERTSVMFGVSGGVADLAQKYIVRAHLPQFIENPDASLWDQLPEWTEDSFAGLLPNVNAGRVSNRFDLGGPNFTVDAACASSLAAIYLACKGLADGSSDLAIAGGCDMVQNQFAYLCFATAGALSPRGKSRAFDAGADGIAISEGLAAIVLKRRADAERDGDRIYAVIRAAAGASDGKSKGLTAPRPEGQMRTVERAYEQAGFSPATVALFEAHGTGTAVGDATECDSLARVLTRHGAAPGTCAIGSIKSMIGHTKSSAGVAGLVKAALALYHRVLPPTLHVEKPNPKAGLVGGPLYVNSETRPWIAGPTPRRAGVSSFGFGGTNFHIALEEYADDAVAGRRPKPHREWPSELFVFAGKSPADLATRARGFAAEIRQALEAGAELELADLAFTLHRRAGTTGQRAAVVAANVPELLELLDKLVDALSAENPSRLPAGVYYTASPLGQDAPLAFLFPGQGAQFPDMLRDLAVEFPEVADCFADADRALASRYDQPLSRFIFPPPAFTDEERTQAIEALKATTVTQPALGVCGLALRSLLASFGIRPAMAAGHSYGELVALCAGGAMDEADLYRLSWARGDSMTRPPARSASDGTTSNGTTSNGTPHDLGTMLAVQGDPARVRQAVADCEGVWFANHNSPQQLVLSGTQRGIAGAKKALDQAGLTHTALAVSCAFHSPLMAPARVRFEQALAETPLRAPRLPVFSNVSAEAHTCDPATMRGLLSEQLVHEVRFVEEVEAMTAAGARVFVELGPNRVVTKLVDSILGDRPHVAVALQMRERHGLTQLLHALATLVTHGIAADLERLYEGRALKVHDLRSPNSLKKPALAAHVWLINGGEARPANQPRRTPKPRALLARPLEPQSMNGHAVSTHGSNGNGHAHEPMQHSVPVTSNGHHAPAVLSVVGPADMDAYATFQETMRHFLLTQERVMETFLTGTAPSMQGQVAPTFPEHWATLAVPEPTTNGHAENGSVHIREGEAPAEPSLQARREPRPPEPGHRLEVVTPTPEPQPAPARASLEDLLLEVASQRTGYPLEMLNLQANLEADLGIDSIKRVEIIAAFRRTALPELQEPPAWFMERMTAAKTLQAIVEGVTELAGKASGTPVVAPSPAPAPRENLEDLLLRITSERTGYPTEMLSQDANLEADLGVDSIKRVEIIAAFRRTALPAVQEPPSWFMEEMTAARTLGAILEGVTRLQSGSTEVGWAESSRPTRSAVDLEDSAHPTHVLETIPRCVGACVELPLELTPGIEIPPGILVLTSDGQGYAESLAREIADGGGKSCILPARDLLSKETATHALARLRQEHDRIAGIIHLLPLQAAQAFPGIEETEYTRHVESELKGLLYLLQALAPELSGAEKQHVLVAAVSQGGGDFGSADDGSQPWRGGLAGMLKTAAREWPAARFRHVDVDELPEPIFLLRELIDEGPVEVGYRQGKRLGIEARRAEHPALLPAHPEVKLDRASVVLITGGAQGITGEIARELAERSQATLILLGRSPAPKGEENSTTAGQEGVELRRAVLAQMKHEGVTATPKDVEARVQRLVKDRDMRGTLTAIRTAGAQVEYHACDVRDSAALAMVVDDVQRRLGPITVLVHGAGTIEDRHIVEKSSESFDRVYHTKVAPMLSLAGVLDPKQLRAVLLFTSVAGFFGNVGQVDYAAANETLNRMARRLRRLWPGKVAALNWGPWTGAGMVTPEVARQFASRGVPMVSVPAGRLAVWQELAHPTGDDVRVVLGPGPWVESTAPAGVAAQAIHVTTPLLTGHNVYRLPENVVEAHVVLDANQHDYLRDHVIDGRPVVPLTVCMELMAETAAAANAAWHVTRVAAVRMFTGIVLDTNQREIVLRAEPIEVAEDWGEWRVRILDPRKKHRALYECRVRLDPQLPIAPEAPHVTPSSEAFPLSTREAYARWLFHGPRFQVIQNLDGLDARGIDATIQPAESHHVVGDHVRQGWLIDPIVLDSAAQLSTLWSRATYGVTTLPNRVDTYHRYGAIGNDPLRMIWRVDRGSDKHTIKAKVLFLRGGRVVGQMDGLEGNGNAELNRITGTLAGCSAGTETNLGSFYVNYSVKTIDTARVADTLRRAQRVAVLTPPQDGYVVVYDQEADSQATDAIEQLGKQLSARAAVLAVLNHDDDVFCYWLFEHGRLVDTFNSNPEFFAEAGESFEAPGDPARLTAVLQVAERVAEVRAILQEEYDYAGDQHQDLAELLGLPECSVGYGYKYVAQGELEEVPPDQLLWINGP